eukprot:PhF_6_TR37620/c1_g1_i1/m.55923
MSKTVLLCDVWAEVFMFIDDVRLIRHLCRVSKTLRDIIVHDEILWKHMFQRTFPTIVKNDVQTSSSSSYWYKCFVDETQHYGLKTIPKKERTPVDIWKSKTMAFKTSTPAANRLLWPVFHRKNYDLAKVESWRDQRKFPRI